MTERLISIPCSWCNKPNGPDAQVWWEKKNRLTSAGVFGDFDWEPSMMIIHGIPVCGGCGGLGQQFESEEFEQRTTEIQNLRFKFADAIKNYKHSEQLTSLLELKSKIQKLVVTYGHGLENSFAQAVTGGLLDQRIEYLEKFK